jgi:hypothetical protein
MPRPSKDHKMSTLQRIMLLAALFTFFVTLAHGATIAYCSPDNTGADTGYQAGTGASASRITLLANHLQPEYNQYQSDGSCQVKCQDSYAFAVLQGVNCWCSDYAPSEQKQTNLCNDPCPGFPGDWCGNPSAGLYGYVALSSAPSGTIDGALLSTQASSSIISVSSTPSTRQQYSPSYFSTSAVETTPTSGASIATLIFVVSAQSSVQASSSTVETSSAVTVSASSATTSSITV